MARADRVVEEEVRLHEAPDAAAASDVQFGYAVAPVSGDGASTVAVGAPHDSDHLCDRGTLPDLHTRTLLTTRCTCTRATRRRGCGRCRASSSRASLC